jgi:hypothetical protein
MRCIYCSEQTNGNESEDHPLPQALGTAAYVLPKGAVCDACNAYLGDLDHNLCNHHHLAGLIVFGQLPGTDGRRRKFVAPGLVFDSAKNHLDLRGGRVTHEAGQFKVRDPGNERFDQWKFSRGLHRLGLGVYALVSGPTAALEPRYDAIRRYIRQPSSRSEFMAYLQRPSDRILGNRTMPVAVRHQGFKTSFAVCKDATFAYIHLFVSEFIVALAGDVRLLHDGDRQQLAVEAGVPEVGVSKRPWLTFENANPGPLVEIDFAKVFGRAGGQRSDSSG